LTVLGAVFPDFRPDKHEIWHGPLPRAKFHVYPGNVSPLRGEKPIFGPLSKNNTGMAALRAGLPVINLFKKLDLTLKTTLKLHITIRHMRCAFGHMRRLTKCALY